MADRYIKPNRLVTKIDKCESINQRLAFLTDVLKEINDNYLGELTDFKCGNPSEIIIYHKLDFGTNMIMILYDNGDIEYNSTIGSDYFLKDEIPEQKMKTVLESFLEGDYKLRNLYYSEKLVQSDLFVNGKIVNVKGLSFVNRIRRYFYPNNFELKDEVIHKFY